MTRTARLLTAGYLTVFVVLTYVAAVELDQGATRRGLAAYAGALGLLAAAAREVTAGGTAQAEAVRTGRPRPRTFPSDLEAVMRAELDQACGCDLWWTTFGDFHSWDCPRINHQARRHEEN
ncbi:hypothetical protein [Streptomyces sp. NPDC057250]|uniref:hypothetical protein n=1 Tax=Streptomyces sp. NPDC057250 TaxID=3346068 RepID=UPI00363A3764